VAQQGNSINDTQVDAYQQQQGGGIPLTGRESPQPRGGIPLTGR
jgi:hypothetical protein